MIKSLSVSVVGIILNWMVFEFFERKTCFFVEYFVRKCETAFDTIETNSNIS